MELLAEDAIMISTSQNEDGSVDLGSALPSNLYFTICDDMSNDSQDFLSINTGNSTTQIKQEPKMEVNHAPLQYRLISNVSRNGLNNSNQTSMSSCSVALRSVNTENSNVRTTSIDASNLLPNAVQLPSGCEIYLVKEYVDSDCGDMLLTEDCEETAMPNRLNLNNSLTQTATKITSVSFTPKAIKTEPGVQNQLNNNHVISPKIEKSTIKAAAGSTASNYKRRDEKRRATHNEVERRRRDKINSWIFKLKEMLPPESSVNNNGSLKSKTNVKNIASCNTNTFSTTAPTQFEIVDQAQQQTRNNSNNNRTPPSDSKSQILIKACEYIKQMQEEIKSLRECLMENEKLRSSNQRLQNELNKLKLNERRRLIQDQQRQINIDNSNIIDSSDDFTMTLCANNNNGHLGDVATSSFFASDQASPSSIALIGGVRKTSISVPYTKRELIISDYVD